MLWCSSCRHCRRCTPSSSSDAPPRSLRCQGPCWRVSARVLLGVPVPPRRPRPPWVGGGWVVSLPEALLLESSGGGRSVAGRVGGAAGAARLRSSSPLLEVESSEVAAARSCGGPWRRPLSASVARARRNAPFSRGFAAFIVALVLIFMARQFLKLKRFYEQNGGPILQGVKNIKIYRRKQIKQITNGYNHIIGEGNFGKVYMGTLENNQPVAIKMSIKVDKEMKAEFTDEVIIQSEMRHKNIARLLGCCLEMDVPMLVYEYASKGSLYDILFGLRRIGTIPVNIRLGIAVGSAEGLTYMHSAGECTIRHGDVKSANILLDENYCPKVSDFGTSKLLAGGKPEKTERVVGDMSYIDPIYMDEGIITQKSDVYSFGIVLIELITRRPATYCNKRSYVANFVEACLHKSARNFIDNDITSEEDIKLLEMVSGVAVECVKVTPEERLDMKQVEHRLLQIVGQGVQHGQERKYQADTSPAPDDVALLKASG